MRPNSMLRRTRSVHALIATATLTVPASAAAVTGVTTDPPGAQAPTISLRPTPARARYRQPLTVVGQVSPAAPGQTVSLEAKEGLGPSWRRLARAATGADGGFALRARLRRSGLIRVVSEPSAATPPAAPAPTPPAADAPAGAASAVRHVSVAASLHVPAGPKAVLGGPLRVRGHVLPGRVHRQVRLQARTRSGWRTVAMARTGAAGGFSLRAGPLGGVRRRLRVVFPGDRLNAAVTRPAGWVTVYEPVTASWYDDSGATACGFHAGLGVASPSLPCGARVRLREGARSVTAVVDDRGPYVGGRQFDLARSTAASLGFSGVGMLWAAH